MKGLALALALLAASGCGGSAGDPRFPPRPAGCAVQVFEQAPSMQTENIGTVTSRCGTDVSRDECIRELKDQACRLGADVIWGVSDAPRNLGDKNAWDGRAAHTK